jgi:hypothetical protein
VFHQEITNNNLEKGNKRINQLPTNVIGKNKEIGFIENLRTLGYSKEEIILEFSSQLDN